jgi:hypothetical protein
LVTGRLDSKGKGGKKKKKKGEQEKEAKWDRGSFRPGMQSAQQGEQLFC